MSIALAPQELPVRVLPVAMLSTHRSSPERWLAGILS